MNSFYPSNRESLAPSALNFLPLGSVKPKGWLKEDCESRFDNIPTEFGPVDLRVGLPPDGRSDTLLIEGT